MNVSKASPLTAPPPKAPLTLTPDEYQARVGSLLSGVDRLEGMIRSMIEEEKKQERISELGGRIYDIAVPAGKGKPEIHPVFENIMKMRGEMKQAEKEETRQKEISAYTAKAFSKAYNIDDRLSQQLYIIGITEETGHAFSRFIDRSLRETENVFDRHDTMKFVENLYKTLGSDFGKKEINLKGEPAFAFDRFEIAGLEPVAEDDENDYDTDYKKDEKGNSYAHITKVESKTYDIFENIPYNLVETITYEWDVDTYTDEYGEEVADDEDIDYYTADRTFSYKLVRK